MRSWRLYTVQTISMLSLIVPSVLVGVPLGVYLIRRLAAETFRRVCMSFDAWVVAFGLSRALMDLGVVGNPAGYVVLREQGGANRSRAAVHVLQTPAPW